MTDQVIVTDEGAVRTIRMNRPEKKNALTSAMYDAMAEAIETAGGASPIRCIVIAGAPGAFSAGNDLGDFMKAATGGEGLGNAVLRFLYSLARAERPLVAAVQGVAVGIGTTMMLHCDYAVAASDARFSTPFVALGLVPEAASSLIAPRVMGHRRAFELLVMGKPLSGEEAKACGLINQVAPADQVEAEAMKAAQAIAALPPEGVAISRRLMKGAPDEIVRRIDEEAEQFKLRLQSPEARKAFEAFLSQEEVSFIPPREAGRVASVASRVGSSQCSPTRPPLAATLPASGEGLDDQIGFSPASISARRASRNGGSTSFSPSVSIGSSTPKPGPSEAISNRMPFGSRK